MCESMCSKVGTTSSVGGSDHDTDLQSDTEDVLLGDCTDDNRSTSFRTDVRIPLVLDVVAVMPDGCLLRIDVTKDLGDSHAFRHKAFHHLLALERMGVRHDAYSQLNLDRLD